jgi:SAM-dependent methyltransferase
MTSPFPPHGVDTTVPSAARIYDYLLGGKDNYTIDRQTADAVLEVAPELRDLAAHNRGFLTRTVRFLTEYGVRNFLDLGTGLPTGQNVHQVAQTIDEHARVVYVDHDPSAVAHAQALLCGDPHTATIHADLHDAQTILQAPATRRLLNLTEPSAVLMVAVLHFVPGDLAGVVAPYVDALPPGGYLVVSHVTSLDADPQVRDRIEATYQGAHSRPLLRSPEEITRALEGLTLLKPGLVDVGDWRPEETAPHLKLRILGAVGRKP